MNEEVTSPNSIPRLSFTPPKFGNAELRMYAGRYTNNKLTEPGTDTILYQNEVRYVMMLPTSSSFQTQGTNSSLIALDH